MLSKCKKMLLPQTMIKSPYSIQILSHILESSLTKYYYYFLLHIPITYSNIYIMINYN